MVRFCGGCVNMKEFEVFESKIFDKLKESGLIDRFLVNEFCSTPNIEKIKELVNFPVKIFYDVQGIFYLTEDGVKIYCPEMLTTISEEGEWLSKKLPIIEFDIYQDGNVRKSEEAKALYCVTCVANIMNSDSYKSELFRVASQYDFRNMSPVEESGQTFRALLIHWQSLQSNVTNIVVSACNYRLSDTKKDSEKYLRDGISESQEAELRNLEVKIRSINYTYSEGVLSPLSVKKLTKIQRLTEITKRDDEISECISLSSSGTLYRILNLSSEYIDPVKKKKIYSLVQSQVDTMIQNEEFKDLQKERSQLIAKLTKRAINFERNSVRKLTVERYLTDIPNFVLPKKL